MIFSKWRKDYFPYFQGLKRGILLFVICLQVSSCQVYNQYNLHRNLQQSVLEGRDISIQESDFTIEITPSNTLQETIIWQIKTSRKKVFLSIYLLTLTSIVDALIDAHERGVDVRVLLEKTVYQLPKINHPAFLKLQEAGVDIRWSSESDINFNHSKYAVFDGKIAMIWTGNFTQSTLDTNRDFFVFINRTDIAQALEDIFVKDFYQITTQYSGTPLLISPDNARIWIMKFIETAQNSIILFAPSLEDLELIWLLERKKREWIRIFLCTPVKDRAISVQNLKWLSGKNVTIFWSNKPFTHGKTILIDEKNLLVGSMNFTNNSLTNNREVGIILPILNHLELYHKIFQTDCKE